MQNHYSATSFLAWAINHYWYSGTHYTWAASAFYPYRLPNPKSSNPLLSYVDLYEPWKDSDPYDKFVAQHRLNLRKGVIAQQKAKKITPSVARRLKKICDKVELLFLYPIVYRIDVSAIPSYRIKTGVGSGAAGSSEVLIADLGEAEFDLLFFDFDADADFKALCGGVVGDSKFAFPILEGRC